MKRPPVGIPEPAPVEGPSRPLARRASSQGRTPAPPLVAVVLAAALPAAACVDNSLPPNALPQSEASAKLPRWYPEAAWTAKGGSSRIYIEGKIVFETSRHEIRPGSEKVLNTLLQFIQDHPEVTRIRIEGHTDAVASEEFNQKLSARRALSVADWLVDKGVDATKLIAVGFGEARPLGPNENAAGRSENRRTEFHVAELDGRPFLGKDPYAGGYSLTVKSKEEREREKEAARLAKIPKPLPPFKPEGDVVKNVDVKPPRTMDEDEPPVIKATEAAPPPADDKKKDGDGKKPAPK
jgi:OOP family OmpA-OmpF porin